MNAEELKAIEQRIAAIDGGADYEIYLMRHGMDDLEALITEVKRLRRQYEPTLADHVNAAKDGDTILIVGDQVFGPADHPHD